MNFMLCAALRLTRVPVVALMIATSSPGYLLIAQQFADKFNGTMLLPATIL